jgi:diaminopimelate decarboxylase
MNGDARETKARPSHPPQTAFPVVDNCLQVAGTAVTELAGRADGRAFYAYDGGLITKKVTELRAALPRGIELHYAIKANPMPEVVGHLAKLTDGLDVASARELAVALATGIAPGDISFAGPGKSDEDLRAAVDAGVIIVVESRTELHRVADLADAGAPPTIAIRVNPDFELKASGMKMGGGAKPFGVDAEQVPALFVEASEMPVDLVGLHIFSGSQNLRAEALMEAHDKTIELALRLAASAPRPLRWLNIGGGLGVPYFPGEQALDLEPVMTNLEARIAEVRARLPEVTVVMELGRYLVAEAGVYVARVTDKKVSRGQTFLVTNGGLHHHLALSGNFGQVIRKNYPVCIGNRVTGDELENVTIVGPLCTPLDLLAERMDLPRAEIGDLVVVFQSGAYGFTASPRGFLSHPEPVELFLGD